MRIVYNNCCGLDVHKKIIVCCIRNGKNTSKKTFGATTDDLESMADWLVDNTVDMVAMESTASYWKPVFNILEERGLKAMVVNAQHMKNVPGKKTDENDAEWIADLLQHGLLNASYIPPREQRELRETLVYRRSLVSENTAELNRAQKMLEGANIKLSGTISNIDGMSGRYVLDELIAGKHLTEADIIDLQKKGHVSPRLKATPKELAKALNGLFTTAQLKNLQDALSHHDNLAKMISKIGERIRESLSDEQKEAVSLLRTIPGVSELSAISIVAVIGTDMDQFETADRLCSWAGICPGNYESAGKKRPTHCTKGNGLLRYTLIQCAAAASRTKGTFLKARHDKIAYRRGKCKAKMAIARSILVSIFHMLRKRETYKDLGSDYYKERNMENEKKIIRNKIQNSLFTKEEMLEILKEVDFSYPNCRTLYRKRD